MRRNEKYALFGVVGVGLLLMGAQSNRKPARTESGPYQVTPEDKLWLLRAVEQEGPVKVDVATALVNLFVHIRSKGSKWALKDLVRAYASPVNPLWYENGDKFKAYIDHMKPGPSRDKEILTARAREQLHSKKTSFLTDTKVAVDKALSVGLHPGDWTDYAAPHIDSSDKYERRTVSVSGKNTFWSRAPGWPGYKVLPGSLLVSA